MLILRACELKWQGDAICQNLLRNLRQATYRIRRDSSIKFDSAKDNGDFSFKFNT